LVIVLTAGADLVAGAAVFAAAVVVFTAAVLVFADDVVVFLEAVFVAPFFFEFVAMELLLLKK
jgi:hypothetical protein